MCCLMTVLLVLGARFVDIIWWIAQPARWDAAFSSALWPILGIVFAPWTTMMWVLVSPGGINGIDYLWVGLAVLVDIASWSGGAREGRNRMSGSSQTA